MASLEPPLWQALRSDMATAFVFPGQGSRKVGMGKALAEAFDVCRETFMEADEVLGND